MIDSSHMSLTDLQLNSVFDKLGLSYRGTFTLREIISEVKKTGLEIASVTGIPFSNNTDILNMPSDDFRKKFFANVFYRDDEEKKNNFKKIIENLDNSYILNELQIISGDIIDHSTFIKIGEKSQIMISGNDITDMSKRISVIVIRTPY